MQIAFLHAESLFPRSGSNLRGHAVLEALVQAGHEIDLVAPRSEEGIDPSIKRFSTSPIDRFSRNKAGQHVRFMRESLALRKQMRARYDLVYAHRLASAPLGRLLARQSDAPLVADLWEVDLLEVYPFENPLTRVLSSLSAPWYEKRYLREAQRVIVLTGAMKSYVDRRFGVDSVVSYDAADGTIFRESSPGRSRPTGFRMVFHGGMDRRDGLVDFLETFAMVASRADVELLLIGKGRALPDIEKRIAGQKWSGRVRLAGWLDYESVPAALAESDLAVIPSLDTRMNRLVLPRKTFEYLSLGIPILATDLPVMREVLNDWSATLVPPREPERVAHEILRLIGEPERRDSQRRRLLARARDFDLRREVQKIVQVVEGSAQTLPPPSS